MCNAGDFRVTTLISVNYILNMDKERDIATSDEIVGKLGCLIVFVVLGARGIVVFVVSIRYSMHDL